MKNSELKSKSCFNYYDIAKDAKSEMIPLNY